MFINISLAVALTGFYLEPVSDNCLPPDEARQQVTSEKLIDSMEAVKLAQKHQKGEIVSANLCRDNQRLVYVLAILGPDGKVSRISVDARTKAIHNR